MRITIYIIAVTLCVACQHRPAISQAEAEKVINETEVVLREVQQVLDDTTDTTRQIGTGATSSSFSSHYQPDEETNNLRGWDPPSENDMEDNGMRRYMENYDEEGWN